jgi:drug/metabolite transporter (DMT)-like permease
MNRSMLAGITAAVLAAISWSLGYIVPFVIGKYSPFDFALVEFVFAGLLSAGLLWRKRAVVRLLTFNDWWVAGSLGLIGYACYFLAIMAWSRWCWSSRAISADAPCRGDH